MDIVPPEVPKLGVKIEKKEGFFSRLFSKKTKDVSENKKSSEYNSFNEFDGSLDSSVNTTNKLDMSNIELPELPESPFTDSKINFDTTSELENSLPKINIGKAKGKGITKKISKMEVSDRFNWTDTINEQDNVIRDSNKENKDINQLLTDSMQHIEDQKRVLDKDFLSLPETLPEMTFDNPKVPDVATNVMPMPIVERQFFNKIDKEHKRLREKLKKGITKYNKQEYLMLLKQYDDKIESQIEKKQIEFSNKDIKLTKLSKTLSAKQKELTALQNNLKVLETRLNAKQDKIEQIITQNVEKQLLNRSRKEKVMLKKELEKTISMNNDLKKKLDTIQKDRILLESTKQKMEDEHRKKLTRLQQIYEIKLSELTKERNAFEERRKNSIQLLQKADVLQKEQQNLNKLRDLVEKKKEALNTRLYEDKELKQAIDEAEIRLSQDRENLDNMIFSKYIQWKLSEPDDTKQITDILKNPLVEDINNKIVECRAKLLSGKILDSKKMYNDIKYLFETSDIDDYNRSLLFNSIRELYSDIQIASIRT